MSSIPESEEVRREHWRRGDFRHLLPSTEWAFASFGRLSAWCWDNYAILLVAFCVFGPIVTWAAHHLTKDALDETQG